jgi:hypothetical protein
VTRRRIAFLLTALVAASGVLPLLLLSVFGLQILRERGERSSQEALQAIAEQAAARIAAYISQQRQMLRALAMAVGGEADAVQKLTDARLDAPSLGRLHLVSADTPPSALPRMLRREQVAAALRGSEVASDTYLAELAPAMDVCVPAGKPGHAVCSTLDLLELQRQVQRIRVGTLGFALAFDRTGRLLAAGAGAMRAAVLSGDPVAESALAAAFVKGALAEVRLRNGEGRDVLAGWAKLPDPAWIIAVEQPVEEALRGARAALGLLGLGATVTLLISIVIGYTLARRMLASLELEEASRTISATASPSSSRSSSSPPPTTSTTCRGSAIPSPPRSGRCGGSSPTSRISRGRRSRPSSCPSSSTLSPRACEGTPRAAPPRRTSTWRCRARLPRCG